MRKLLLAIVTVTCCYFGFTLAATAKTLILEGTLDGSVAMRQTMEFSVNQGPVSSLSFRFALPATFSSRTVSQTVAGFQADITPRPASSVVETDRFGNRFQRVSWENVTQNIRVNLTYTANVNSSLTALESRTPFPLGRSAAAEELYLKPTDMVQSGHDDIATLARQLTRGAKSEYEAVTAVTNWVADNIKYTFNPPRYDAVHTLTTRSGNCQNFAHLSIALLRSQGIPARIVGGITLKDSWKVPIDARNSIVQSMGQGGHAWLEVWFPDLGWLPYDPQQSKQFTSSRHIKQSHGLDSKDINDTWRGGPYLPAYSESIDGRYLTDTVNLRMQRFHEAPRPYLLSNLIATVVPGTTAAVEEPKPQQKPVAPSKPQPPPEQRPAYQEPQGGGAGPVEVRLESDDDPVVAQVPQPAKPVKPAQKTPQKPTKPSQKPQKPLESQPVVKQPRPAAPGTPVVFGNMDFPALVNLYSVKGNTGTRIFERETSEYVSSRHIFAQAIQVKERISLDKVSLAMRKFGGDGAVYIDLVKDRGGKPDIMQGIRSNLLDLEKIPRRPGYYWVDFTFPRDNTRPHHLVPGKYWIVFRASGEAIMNWFFIPGKPYSSGDDTRSTAKGFQWEDILNYDFVFKVSGKTL